MRIAACQLPEVHADMDRALWLIDFHAANAQRQGAKLVCFPECFLQGYDVGSEHVRSVALELGSPRFKRILRRLEGLEPVIVLGLIEQQASKFYNTAVVIERGVLVTTYRKAHLVGGEQAIFDAGSEYPVFELGHTKVGINICSVPRLPQGHRSTSPGSGYRTGHSMRRAILITGASRGIGRATAIAFAERGDRVAIHHRDSEEAAQRLRLELAGEGHVVVQADLAQPSAIETMVTEAAAALGGLDVLVNNAARSRPHVITDVSYG